MPNGISLPLDDSGRSTGEAFVEFATPKGTEGALERHKQKIGHRLVGGWSIGTVAGPRVFWDSLWEVSIGIYIYMVGFVQKVYSIYVIFSCIYSS